MDAAASPIRAGMLAGLPLVLPVFALGVSFGVLARPVMGRLAPGVMSVVVFAGAAQFASLSVIAAGGGAAAAIAAGLLMNTRFLPMGFAAARAFAGGPLRRGAEGQGLVDASWALASRGDGTYDRGVLLGASIPQGIGWIVGTVVGVLGGAAIGDLQRFGLDAIFPAFYLALLAGELRTREAKKAAALGAAIALVLMPVAPGGVPVIAASVAALLAARYV